MMLLENLSQDQASDNEIVTAPPVLTKGHLDALSRIFIWGPIGIYGAAGKEIPTVFKLIMLGVSLVQVVRGVNELNAINRGKSNDQKS